MDFVLAKCLGTVGIADDVAVYGSTEAEDDFYLHNLTMAARHHGLVFNLYKYKIKEPQITFFGVVYDAERVHLDREKVEAIKAITEPQGARNYCQFSV